MAPSPASSHHASLLLSLPLLIFIQESLRREVPARLYPQIIVSPRADSPAPRKPMTTLHVLL